MSEKPRSAGPPSELTLLEQILQRLIRMETRQVKQMGAMGLNPDGSVCEEKKAEEAHVR